MILAGDIGGTKTTLAVFGSPQAKPEVLEKYPSREYAQFEDIVLSFLKKQQITAKYACFCIAGPVKQGRAAATNLPWVLDVEQMAMAFELERVWLINDLESNAHGIPLLEKEDLLVINPGDLNAQGNAAVISAGTGLGEAGIYWDGQRHVPFAGEGGHCDFAPESELQVELLSYLMQKFDHVSYETVLSGPGLANIYQFLKETGAYDEPSWLAELLASADPAPQISSLAMQNESAICKAALDLFVTIYGAEAGNLALKMLALGGVYLGGGIAPKIAPRLQQPDFMQAFCKKGKMQKMLEAVPVKVILNDQAALIGAADYARRRI